MTSENLRNRKEKHLQDELKALHTALKISEDSAKRMVEELRRNIGRLSKVRAELERRKRSREATKIISEKLQSNPHNEEVEEVEETCKENDEEDHADLRGDSAQRSKVSRSRNPPIRKKRDDLRGNSDRAILRDITNN